MTLLFPMMAILMAFADTSRGQILYTGRCPHVTPMQNHDLSRYVGVWYEYAKYPTYQVLASCTTITYTELQNRKFGVVVNDVFAGLLKRTVHGQAVAVDASKTEGRYSASFDSFIFGFDSSPGNYNVLDTDYTSYSIVWSCRQYLSWNLQILRVLTRSKTPSKATLTKIREVISSSHLDSQQLRKTDYNNCPQ